MKRFAALFVVGLLAAAGCTDTKSTSGSVTAAKAGGGETDVAANLGKLSADDRALAESQKWCPVTDELLGSMGVPIKLDIKDQPVFICCKSCEKGAKKDPDKTLQKVADLKAKGGKDK